MGLTLRLGLGLGVGGGVATQPAGPTITAPGSIDVTTYKIGTEHTITAGSADPTGGGDVSYEYIQVVEGDFDNPVGTSAAYTPQAADDTLDIAFYWRAVEANGTNDGATAWQLVGSGTVTYVAPTIDGAPVISGTEEQGQTLTATPDTVSGGTATETYQWKRSGTNILGATSLTYVLQAADVGETLTFVHSAVNSGGSDSEESSATGTIAAADTTAPEISSLSGGSQSSGNLPITITVTENCTVDWVLSTSATQPTPAQVAAGQDHTGSAAADSGSFSATGSDTYNEALSSGLSGTYYLHCSPIDAASNRSTEVDSTTGLTIDTTGPALVPASSTPADEDTDVAADATITLIFSETVFEGTGNIYFYEDTVLAETVAIASCTIGTTDVVVPHGDFTAEATVSVRMDAGVVVDAQGNGCAAVSDDTTLNFDIEAAAGASHTFKGELPAGLTTGTTHTWTDMVDEDGHWVMGIPYDEAALVSVVLGGVTLTAKVDNGHTSGGRFAWYTKPNAVTGDDLVVTSSTGTRSKTVWAWKVVGYTETGLVTGSGNNVSSINLSSVPDGALIFGGAMGAGVAASPATIGGDVTQVDNSIAGAVEAVVGVGIASGTGTKTISTTNISAATRDGIAGMALPVA